MFRGIESALTITQKTLVLKDKKLTEFLEVSSHAPTQKHKVK